MSLGLISFIFSVFFCLAKEDHADLNEISRQIAYEVATRTEKPEDILAEVTKQIGFRQIGEHIVVLGKSSPDEAAELTHFTSFLKEKKMKAILLSHYSDFWLPGYDGVLVDYITGEIIGNFSLKGRRSEQKKLSDNDDLASRALSKMRNYNKWEEWVRVIGDLNQPNEKFDIKSDKFFQRKDDIQKMGIIFGVGEATRQNWVFLFIYPQSTLPIHSVYPLPYKLEVSEGVVANFMRHGKSVELTKNKTKISAFNRLVCWNLFLTPH